MDNSHTYALIMAGGIGSRFWPYSTAENPKQFHDFLGTGKSLLRHTFDRLNRFIPAEQILVVTNKMYVDQVQEHLPSIPSRNIIGEPDRRNTAPCIYLSSLIVNELDSEAQVIVAPADHLILDEKGFQNSVEIALHRAKSDQALVTLGIEPNRPDTGYGYIQYDKSSETESKPVISFTEKPDRVKAESFLEAGNYLWNSGIFIWNNQDLLTGIEKHASEISSAIKEVDLNSELAVAKAYAACPNISIDYALMEKSEKVFVVPSEFSWSDLGTWGSVYEKLEKDKNGNASSSEVLFQNTRGSLVVDSEGKQIVLESVEDLILINTPKAILVCHRDAEQNIKQIVARLSAD